MFFVGGGDVGGGGVGVVFVGVVVFFLLYIEQEAEPLNT